MWRWFVGLIWIYKVLIVYFSLSNFLFLYVVTQERELALAIFTYLIHWPASRMVGDLVDKQFVVVGSSVHLWTYHLICLVVNLVLILLIGFLVQFAIKAIRGNGM